jgi:hypothetical protein
VLVSLQEALGRLEAAQGATMPVPPPAEP